MTNPHPLSCRCGAFRAEINDPRSGTRAVCYCKDCQAFAHFLDLPPGMLDRFGGTGIVAIAPRKVRFTAGVDQLQCMSLSPRGTLRWYTACCRTPVGNTPRDPKISHVGLIHLALAPGGQDLAAAFGPVRMHVNRQSARGTPPASSPFGFAAALANYLMGLAWSRLGGRYRANPFFDTASGKPLREPQVVTREERERLKAAVEASAAMRP